MKDDFLINLDQLRKRGNQNLEMSVSTDFLSVEEGEFHFAPQLTIQGEAYIVDERLILHLDISVPVAIFCKICREETTQNLSINNLYHVVEINEIKSTIFDFSSVLQDEIFLEVPRFAECRDGNCPERETLKKYLTSKKSS
ncbi:MAG: hypothetical protein S4CHLAM7_12230 [Chlamydiae bacterium]|nr:hypothetical protein [Chlamydiota bacterium]